MARQSLELLVPGAASGGHGDGRPGETEKEVRHELPVEERMVGLVGVAHQTVVTGRLALLLRSRSLLAIYPGVGIEVGDLQGAAGHPRECVQILDETP